MSRNLFKMSLTSSIILLAEEKVKGHMERYMALQVDNRAGDYLPPPCQKNLADLTVSAEGLKLATEYKSIFLFSCLFIFFIFLYETF